MSWIDWVITIVPICFVLWLGWHVRKYIIGVSDYLVAGRVCHRYVISTSGMANILGLVTLAAYVEVHYKTGFAMSFWHSLLTPLSVFLGLTGYCIYRFRETRSMSIGQFLEMRYNRSLRIFACFLRSIAEMMANIIMPAIAARFFIYYLGLPEKFNLFGWQCPTFMVIVVITLTMAISLICMGGTLSIVITDTMQGLLFFPTILIFIVFILSKFSWSQEIVQVMSDRAPGESFMNPYDVSRLRDFNMFALIVTFMGTILHRASGLTGNSNSAVSAHESKMGSLLGTWRGAFTSIFYVLIAVSIITMLHHSHFADDAKIIRTNISQKIANELIPDNAKREQFMADIKAIPAQHHVMGKDKPFSQKENPDEIYFKTAQKNFGLDGQGSSKTQQFKTIFRQLMLPAAMRHMLPVGLVGLFCMMILLFIVSTDDSRIYSASSTLVQDCVVPFYKNENLSPEKHIRYIRWISIGVGVFFLCGSCFMAQLDYINLFINIMYGMWTGGCGPMLVFGLYSRFGTAAGAWCSLLSGMSINLFGALMQRNWADHIYPFLEQMGWVDGVGNFLSAVSRPFNPYIVWEMNRLRFPINSYEIYFIAMSVSLIVYCVVSWLTCKEPFNLERMLHRGKYAIEGEKKIHSKWTLRTVFSKLIGITPEYTLGDKILAWSVFSYSLIYKFLFAFVLVVILNVLGIWKVEWWGHYFLVVFLLVPGTAALITAVWFGFGCTRDLIRMFRDLKNRVANPLDNGMVEGHVAIAEKARLDQIDKDQQEKK